MRFDVPNVGDPNGAYAGAISRIMADATSGFDALTFWAKATKTGTINEIGLDKTLEKINIRLHSNLELTTYWKQYTIAIPDPSKLTRESGFVLVCGRPEDGEGYSFWIWWIAIWKLGTVAQPKAFHFWWPGCSIQTFAGVTTPISGLKQTVNLGNGTGTKPLLLLQAISIYFSGSQCSNC